MHGSRRPIFSRILRARLVKESARPACGPNLPLSKTIWISIVLCARTRHGEQSLKTLPHQDRIEAKCSCPDYRLKLLLETACRNEITSDGLLNRSHRGFRVGIYAPIFLIGKREYIQTRFAQIFAGFLEI